MHITHHAGQRMGQRGISRRLVEFALRHGRIEGDRHVLDRKVSRRLVDELNEELRLAKQVLDKGGVTVVASAESVVTTYNRNVPMSRRGALSSGHRRDARHGPIRARNGTPIADGGRRHV